MMSPLARLVAPLLLSTAAITTCHASSPLTPSGNAAANRPYMPPAPGTPADHHLRPTNPMPPTSSAFQDQEQQDMDSFEVPGEHHVAVEERLSAWRQQQQDRYEHYTPEQLGSMVDDEGRTKLLTTMSRTSVPIMFFILLTRSIHHFELADASFRGNTRLVFVLPAIILFLCNLSGVAVGALTSIKGTGGTKRRLKAILNLNKLLEVLCGLYNIVRLTVAPSKYVPREAYVARIVTNFMFLAFSQVYSKVTWGGISAKDPMLAAESPYRDSYDGMSMDNDDQQQQYGGYEQQQYGQSGQYNSNAY
mmetsp:Transcript_12375/g.26210  ORF Transcript_12375/g.26210 Transcript_12375/m.26210 type:complete len:305 (+) Transcript_12375:82-996(+)